MSDKGSREFDVEFARKYGQNLFGGAPDTIGQSYVLQAMRKQYDLDSVLSQSALKRIEELEHELKSSDEQADIFDKKACESANEVQSLTAQNDVMREALKFYADDGNWDCDKIAYHDNVIDADDMEPNPDGIGKVGGKRAREATTSCQKLSSTTNEINKLTKL